MINNKNCTSNTPKVKKWFKNYTNIPLLLSYLLYNFGILCKIVRSLYVYPFWLLWIFYHLISHTISNYIIAVNSLQYYCKKKTFGTHLLCFSSFCTFCYSMSDRKVNTKCFNKSIKTVRISISVCLTKRNQIYTMYSIYAVAMSHTQREIRTHQFV